MLADGTFASVAAASAHLRLLGRERAEAARHRERCEALGVLVSQQEATEARQERALALVR